VTLRPNPLVRALGERRFCYVVELVASALKRESQVLEVASRLARVPEVVAGSITSYAGGAIGQDPIRLGTAARARGLTPNVHVTCVSQHREGLRKTLEDLQALGLMNVFALTGDWPKEGTPVFDLDSVQLVRMIADMRRAGLPFHIAVAVSPFKYVEADQVYQYLKLEKKIAAGADLAITQVGWDARKFAELRRHLRERGVDLPVLGSVYVLGPRAAEKMAKGEPPGCWVSPELLARVRAESKAPDGGLRARLERAAWMVAVLRGLGYAGAYIGGTHDAGHVQWIIRRAEALAPRWEEVYGELQFGRTDGFYLYDRSAVTRSVVAARLPRILDGLARVFPLTHDSALRRLLRRLFTWIDRRPPLARIVERAELALKKPVFGCQACGNCVLSWMEYVCPQTCPKQMRNGPCGGTHMGRCEVRDQPCIWVDVHARATAAGRVDALRAYVPPPDRSLTGTSSWINYFLERDSRPRSGRPEQV